MLSGEYKHSLDPKNRLFIPSKHREELGSSFVVAKSIREQCLRVYSSEGWAEYIRPITSLDGKDKERIIRALSRNAAQVSPDSQGRIVLTPVLMQYAQIEKSVVIVGCGTCAEIWSERLYDEMNAEEDMEDIRNTLEAYGL